MRIAEYSYAIRIKLENQIQSLLKRVTGLLRKAINQVGIDAFKSESTSLLEQCLCMFERLNPAYRQLYIPVEILNAHAHSIKSQVAQRAKMFERRYPRIDLDRTFAAGGERKPLANRVEEIGDLARAQVGWGPASPMHLRRDAAMRYISQVHLRDKMLEIRTGNGVISFYDNIASAIQAQPFAKGDVYINRERLH